MSYLVSIVIPSFNAGDYILECVESVFAAPGFAPDVEVVLVDDGSVDFSVEKVVSVYGSYIDSGNLKVIRQDNSGVSKARNVGVSAASGKYISFVDSDDALGADYFLEIRQALENDPDIVFYNMQRFDRGRSFCVYVHNKNGFLEGENSRLEAFLLGAWYNCLRVIKRELFQGVEFPEGHVFEDVRTIPLLYCPDVKVYYISSPIYRYRINYHGISASVDASYESGLREFYQGHCWGGDVCSVIYRLQILRLILNFSVIAGDSKDAIRFVVSEIDSFRVPVRYLFRSKFVRFGMAPRVYYLSLLIKKRKKAIGGVARRIIKGWLF